MEKFTFDMDRGPTQRDFGAISHSARDEDCQEKRGRFIGRTALQVIQPGYAR